MVETRAMKAESVIRNSGSAISAPRLGTARRRMSRSTVRRADSGAGTASTVPLATPVPAPCSSAPAPSPRPTAGWDCPHPRAAQEPTEVGYVRTDSHERVPCGEPVVVTSPQTAAEAKRDALRRRGRPVSSRSTMHRLATLSLSNRAFIALVCITVAILGVMSMSTLRQELIPSVTLPQIQVVTTSPGSSTEQVKDRISTPVENSVRGLENVETTSSSSESSLSMVTVELTYGTDIARSSNQVEAALSQIEDDLPEGAEPEVIAGGTGDIPAAVLSISSDLEPAELADRLNSSVVTELERLDGVSGVMVAGAPEQIVRITPDEAALAERGMSTETITDAIDASGLSVPGGTVVDEDRSLDVTIGEAIDSVESLEQIALLPPEDAEPDPTAEATTLADVATVEQTEQEATNVSRTNGRESLVMIVNTTADGNVVDVSEGVEAELDGLIAGVGGNAEASVVFDQAPFIQESIVALAEEGLLGLLFAVGVIMVFLRAVRPTAVTAISIPMSLLMAFVGMLLSDYTLNMLTLAALTISIGRVVDDSIVVIENITRHLTYGKTRMRAVADGVREVAGAITAATLATAARSLV